MSMNILAVINTYNLNHVPHYLERNLKGWFNQQIAANLDVVLSNNMPKINVNPSEMNAHNFYVVNIYDHYPVYVTFNATIKYFNLHKSYDFYVYCAEDCIMTQESDLRILIDEFTDDIGLVSALVDNDNSLFYPHYNNFNQSTIVKLGESVNMHQFVFSKYFMQMYDFKYVDLLSAYATESLLTFLLAAISKKWLHCGKVLLNHNRSGNQKGFIGHQSLCPTGFESIFRNGQKVGLGFECCQNWYPYDASLYDSNEECLYRESLYSYIKDNLFVKSDVVNYDNILKNMQVLS